MTFSVGSIKNKIDPAVTWHSQLTAGLLWLAILSIICALLIAQPPSSTHCTPLMLNLDLTKCPQRHASNGCCMSNNGSHRDFVKALLTAITMWFCNDRVCMGAVYWREVGKVEWMIPNLVLDFRNWRISKIPSIYPINPRIDLNQLPFSCLHIKFKYLLPSFFMALFESAMSFLA